MAPFRPAARVVCVDAGGRILLLRWHDPYDGSYLWEPPGGGIEAGEAPAETARRELLEETGLTAEITGPGLEVHRDTQWKGRRYVGPEQWFLARFPVHEPPVVRDGLLDYEQTDLDRHAWVPWPDISDMPDRIEPPEMLDVLRRLDPAGPWVTS
ncbi:NUDIX domain-containing protein [Actinoplanes sp. NPDC049596]|uniref:NUDIX domain-containing protein n=1 Tax=unclassified Actinoplanes TaxID=2626549 RepID=UPI0034298D0C